MGLTTLAALPAGRWKLDDAHSELGFTVRHMMVGKIRGRFRSFESTVVLAENPLLSSIKATIDVKSLDTGNGPRDAAVLSAEYLDAENYPQLTFRSTGIRGDGEDYLLGGDLTIRGVTRPVELKVQYNGNITDPFGNERIGFSVQGEINRKVFDISVDIPMDGGGFVVGDKIRLEFELDFVRAVDEPAAEVEPSEHGLRRLFRDDFHDGFTTEGPDARWFYYGFGPYVGDDGVVTASHQGLRVVSSGTNPASGKPAFVRSLAQEDDNGFGLPGTLDHVKWLAFTSHQASTGFNGFDAVPGEVLTCESWMSGRVHGTAEHPFGGAVTNPDDDMRLASVGMPLLDEETSTIFDFFLSNERIYVVYERLPFSRQQLGNYAAFVYQIPVASRSPHDRHHFEICYDRSAGAVWWLLDGREVYRVDRLGYRLESREHLLVDHGGEETLVHPRQLNCGMGMFTALDYGRRDQRALVRISSTENYYFSTATGEPEPQVFLDDESLESNRLFGQGAEIEVGRYEVSSTPAR
ncbi:MAG: YceI family protein [Actinomycetota bacterium]|nr:YceI family protein [Actinomycetota bacterium]